MRLAIAITAVVFTLALFASAVAGIPETISYQGVLRDDTGVPVADGTYDIIFCLYDVETGGTALWCETQTLLVEGGVFNAHLGSVITLTTLDFLVPYWVGIYVEGEGELVPRTAFETVPFAVYASFADDLVDGANWDASGDDVYRDYGNVGVGLPPVGARFDVMAGDMIAGDFDNGSIPSPALRVANAGGTAGAFFSCTDPSAVPDPPAAVYGNGACGARGGHFYASVAEAVYAHTTGVTTALVAEATGTGYAAQFFGDAGIQVQYRADVGSFRMFGGSSPGYVMTSDADGVGTWQPGGGSDGDWVISGANMSSALTGNVGIGDPTPDGKLDISSESAAAALIVEHEGSPGRVVNIERISAPAVGNDMLQIAVPFDSSDGMQFIECERGGVPVFYVMGDGLVVGTSGAYFNDVVAIDDGQLVASYNSGRVAEFTTLNPAAADVLYAEATDVGGTTDGAAVHGKYEQSVDYGIGGKFEGGYIGVWGLADNAGGVLEHIGVRAHASGGGSYNYGISASASGTNACAGYFSGNVEVTGTLTASVKSFKIDHPLDPANKYLVHSCVESDEMKNVYDGVVALDGRGEARVTLPDWFEALNGEYRYQLTCIGAHAPVYIADEIEGGVFAIAGGMPGMKVSWQVTGVRQDPYSLAHRAEVVQEKPAAEVGTYRHPELYGMPETAGVMYREERGPVAQDGLIERRSLEPFDPTDGE